MGFTFLHIETGWPGSLRLVKWLPDAISVSGSFYPPTLPSQASDFTPQDGKMAVSVQGSYPLSIPRRKRKGQGGKEISNLISHYGKISISKGKGENT